jgi:hypothetical protein
MKYLLGMLLAASVAVAGYAQDPGTNINGSEDDYEYNDNTQGSTKGSQESEDKFDANGSRDMNNSSNMNSPLYMDNNSNTLAEPQNNQDAGYNSDAENLNAKEQKMEADNDPNGSKAGNTLDKAGEKSKKGISKGWDKVKHNKLTKHLFNQPRNS